MKGDPIENAYLPQRRFLRDILQWDVVNWSMCLDLWEPFVRSNRPLDCLEIGARKGGLSLWLASRGHRVTCTDISDPREEAQEVHARYPFCATVKYRALDATRMSFDGLFDLVVFKSVLGGIGRNSNMAAIERAVAGMFRALRPGGVLLFAENLKASRLHVHFRRIFVGWGKSWNYLNFSDIQRIFSDFRELRLRYGGFLGAFGRTEGQRSILGLFDRALSGSIPNRWKYIVAGVARK